MLISRCALGLATFSRGWTVSTIFAHVLENIGILIKNVWSASIRDAASELGFVLFDQIFTATADGILCRHDVTAGKKFLSGLNFSS